MADNIAVTPGTGKTVLADEVVDATLGTGIVQMVKIMDGTIDGTSKAAVGANGLKVDPSGVTSPVSIATMPSTPVTGTFWQATQPVSGTVTANIGTAGTLALDATLTGGTQQSKITDGTNIATVKAASTAAIATDKALVVAVSPNNTVPVSGTFWQATQPVSGTFWQATQPVSLTSLPALTTGAAVIGSLVANQSVNNAQFNGVVPLMGNGVTGTGSLRVTIASDNTAFSVNATVSGNLTTVSTVTAVTAITNALPAGTNLMGKVGIDQTTAGTTNGVVENATSAAGGISTTARLASAAASTNATNVKTTAGRIYSLQGKNNAAYDVFLVLYDAATNPPVPGTTTIRKKIVCPAGSAFVYDFPVGLSFSTGIGYAFTKLVADADTTVLVAADITAFNMDYV